jgi:hypothetical protein
VVTSGKKPQPKDEREEAYLNAFKNEHSQTAITPGRNVPFFFSQRAPPLITLNRPTLRP